MRVDLLVTYFKNFDIYACVFGLCNDISETFLIIQHVLSVSHYVTIVLSSALPQSSVILWVTTLFPLRNTNLKLVGEVMEQVVPLTVLLHGVEPSATLPSVSSMSAQEPP